MVWKISFLCKHKSHNYSITKSTKDLKIWYYYMCFIIKSLSFKISWQFFNTKRTLLIFHCNHLHCRRIWEKCLLIAVLLLLSLICDVCANPSDQITLIRDKLWKALLNILKSFLYLMISTNKHLNLQMVVKAKMIFILRTVRPNSKVSHSVTAERNAHEIIETNK